ncbi:MAG TPA: hypothetical protein VME21_07490, partial [Steroidobacteraceae bacterium]|nr:hypothetical protein [Steroidobacteraceae bacterium]
TLTYVGPSAVKGTVYGIDNGLPVGTAGDGEAVAGAYVYTITCGTAPNQAQASAPVTYYTNAPAVTLNVSNPFPQGTPTPVGWQTNIYPCAGTGGLTGDGWAGSKAGSATGSQAVTEATLGSVNFGITCGTGSQTVQAQATTNVITPTVTITASASTLPVTGALTIKWNSNFGSCSSAISPGNGNWGTVLAGSGGFQTTQLVAGTYTYTIICEGGQASTQVTFTGSVLTFSASATNVAVNTPVTLSWSTGGSGVGCMASGGSAGDGWSGSLPPAGTQSVSSASSATVGYGIACNLGDGWSNAPQAQTQVTYTAVTATQAAAPVPAVTLSSNLASQVVGSPVILSWSSQNASDCSASGGTSGDGWSGDLPTSGTMSITEGTAGSFSYDITCTGAPPAASAKAQVDFTDSSVTVSASGGKSGGGGGLDPWCLLLLGSTIGGRLRQRSLTRRA